MALHAICVSHFVNVFTNVQMRDESRKRVEVFSIVVFSLITLARLAVASGLKAQGCRSQLLAEPRHCQCLVVVLTFEMLCFLDFVLAAEKGCKSHGLFPGPRSSLRQFPEAHRMEGDPPVCTAGAHAS